jgi:serine/threonine protein kinase
LVELVGEGSFGEVWLAEYCGALVAVKILAKVRSDNMTRSMQHQLALRHLTKEVMLMSKLRHPNGECELSESGGGGAMPGGLLAARSFLGISAWPPWHCWTCCCALLATLASQPKSSLTHPSTSLLTLPPLPTRPPAVCLYLGACTDPPCLVMEYCAKCSLDMLLKAGLASSQVGRQAGGCGRLLDGQPAKPSRDARGRA